MNPLEQQATAQLDLIFGQMNNLDQVAVQETLQLLEQLRQDVMVALSSNLSEYTRGQVSQVLTALDDATFRFQQRYLTQLTTIQTKGFYLGTQLVDAPISAASALFTAPYIPQGFLELMTNYSADLVRNVTATTRKMISDEIRHGVLLGRSPTEVMTRLGPTLGDGKFKATAQRAATVTRTEVNRVMSAATWKRLEQDANAVPGLQQQWNAANDVRTRPDHAEANGQVVAVGELFEVGGEQLRFPGDPSGSAENTINCRCRLIPTSSLWQAAQPSTQDVPQEDTPNG